MLDYGIFLVLVAGIRASASFSTSDVQPPKTNGTYEVTNVTADCTSEELLVRVELNRNFRGVIYARGFPLEKSCRSLGTGEKFVEISINTSSCGVRLVAHGKDVFSMMVTLNIQTDRFLQQINDIEVSASCQLSLNDMVHTRHVTFNKQISRRGRLQANNQELFAEGDSLSNIKSWMEIEGTSGRGSSSKVSVGEQTLVLVKSLLPDDLTTNVVDCFAHDGTREMSQKLLDEYGCPVDESIMSSLENIKFDEENDNEINWDAGEESTKTGISSDEKSKDLKRGETLQEAKQTEEQPTENRGINVEIAPEGLSSSTAETKKGNKMRMQIIGTMFSAFKFPDTSNLHLKCILQICKHFCPTVPCESDDKANNSKNRTTKSMKLRDSPFVLDRVEVFNSVEVIAPGIDSDDYSSQEDLYDLQVASKERTFCLSASKMAFSFAVLGTIFLCGVFAALWTVVRNQMRKMGKSYDGSEQILVVRDSPMNLIHSRTKPFMNWSHT